MRKSRLFALAMLAVSMTASANIKIQSPYTGTELPAEGGTFYLYQVETGLWLQNNNRVTADWNSRAQLDVYGFDFELVPQDGGYRLNPKFGNNHSLNASNFYMDTNDGQTVWTLSPAYNVQDGIAYNIISGDVTLSANENGDLANNGVNTTWQLVSEAERLTVMQAQYAEASATNPVDLTWLIPGSQFNIADEHAMLLDGANGIQAGAPFVSGQTQANGVREIWNNTAGFDISYTIANLPDGIYHFTVSGYYRDGNAGSIGAKHRNGEEVLRAQYYANDEAMTLMSICAPERTVGGDGCNRNSDGFFIPDNIGDAAIATRQGVYVNTTLEISLIGSTLKVGVRKDGGVDDDWTILDYFKLQYLGPESLDLYIGLLQNIISQAEAFDATTTSTVLADALAAALTEAKAKLSATTKQEIQDATAALESALAVAKSVNVVVLKQTAELAAVEGLNTDAAQTAIAEATTPSQIDQPLYDLRAARKINALRMPDIYTGSAPAEGKVYIFNVGTGLFLGTGSDWNTHAAVDQVGIEVELIADGENFKIKTDRGGGWLNYGGYVDTPSADVWHFLPVDGKTGVYNISSTGNDGFLLGYDPNGGTDGKKYWNTIAIDRTGLDNPMNQFKIITPAEREQLINGASQENPVDVSYLIKNASLNRQDGYDMWNNVCDGGNGGARVSTVNDNNGDRAADFAWEYYEPLSFSFTQSLTGLPQGDYIVSVQGFFRNGNGGAQAEAVNNGEELVQLAYLAANSESELLPNIASVTNKVPGVGDLQNSVLGEFPNMPQSAIEYFETGYYKTSVEVNVGEEGTLTLGVKKDERLLAGDWVVFDNFRLIFKGIDPQTGIQDNVVKNAAAGVVYNLNGQQVKTTQKGLYIKDGRKVIIK